MNRKLKMICVLAILVLSLVLSACGGNNSGSNVGNSSPNATTNEQNSSAEDSGAEDNAADDSQVDTSQEVNLNMVLLGGKPADFDIVWAEVNKKLKEEINTTVEVEFYDWSDWTQKYPLIFAAAKDVDLIYTANWAFYSDQALKGGFMEITEDMLKTYAPRMWTAMPQVRWDQAKVKDKLYMVPNNNQTEFLSKLVMIREDLRTKHNIPEVNDMESLANYMKTVAQNEKDMLAFLSSPPGKGQFNALDEVLLLGKNNWRLVEPTLPLAYKYDDPNGQLFNIYETPEFKELLGYYKELADLGVWSKDILNNQSNALDEFRAGTNGMMTHNLGTLANDMMLMRQNHAEYAVALADVTPNAKRATAVATQNGMAIHAISEKWERALMVIDLLQNDKIIYDLSHFGLVDKHYIPVGDDKLKPTPDKDKYGISSWGWWNSQLHRQNENYPQEASDLEAKWAEQVYHWPLETFVFDISNIKTEVSNIGQAMIRYGAPLEYGLIDDLDKGLDTLLSQVKAGQLDKVQQEAQKQIDEFLTAQ
jgi:putative aldouronate transport system substrate-binding protein